MSVDLFIEIVMVTATVVGAIGTLYLQQRGNRIFEQQNRIMIEQHEATLGKPPSTVLAHKLPRWPLISMAVFLVLIWAAVTVNYFYVSRPFDANKAWDDRAPLKHIYHRSFSNETVPLDGYYYHDSTFDNVTLEYEGVGATAMDNSHFTLHDGKLYSRLASKNKIVTSSMKLMSMMAQMAGCGNSIIQLGPEGNLHSIEPPR